jgi:hypothetical protein
MTLCAGLAFAAVALPNSPALAQSGPPPATAASAIDPERLAIAREVVELAYPPERRREMFMGILDAMTAQARSATEAQGRPLDPGAQAIIDRYMARVRAESEPLIDKASPELFAAFARGYARQFTRDELVQIRAFVATPAGAKYVQRSAQLLSDPDVAEANTLYMSRMMTMLRPLQEQVRRELAAHFAKAAGK